MVLTQSLPSNDLDLMGQQPGHTSNASQCGERAVLTRSLLRAGERRPTLTGLNRKEIHWLRNLECIQAWLDPGSQNRSLGNSLSPPLVPAFLCAGFALWQPVPLQWPQQLLASLFFGGFFQCQGRSLIGYLWSHAIPVARGVLCPAAQGRESTGKVSSAQITWTEVAGGGMW